MEEKGSTFKKSHKIVSVCVILFLLLTCMGFCAYTLEQYPHPKPSDQELEQARVVIERHVEEQWRGKVEVIKIQIEPVKHVSDSPISHSWIEYDYVVHMRIKETPAVFAGSIGRELDLEDTGPFIGEITDDDIALLEAYAAVTDVPAHMWSNWGRDTDPDVYFPNIDIWEVEPINFLYKDPYSVFLFERKDDGSFHFLEQWGD